MDTNVLKIETSSLPYLMDLTQFGASQKMASSSSLPPAMEDGEYINWAELPPELASSIMQRLGAVEILENAQKVCRSWRRVCKDPSMWRKIDMRKDPRVLGSFEYDLEKMCCHAVDRSQGGLLEIDIWYFGTDELLNYIADSSSKIRRLSLAMCYILTNEGLTEAVLKLSLLEDLEVSFCSFSAESIKVVGKSCPNLKTLKLNREAYRYGLIKCDDDALAISETMPGLRHLQLFGNRLSNTGLNAILYHCPNLDHLDLRQCFQVDLVGDLEKQCSQRIKVVRRPNDSTIDYPYEAMVCNMDSYEDSEIENLGWADVYSDDDPFDY